MVQYREQFIAGSRWGKAKFNGSLQLSEGGGAFLPFHRPYRITRVGKVPHLAYFPPFKSVCFDFPQPRRPPKGIH